MYSIETKNNNIIVVIFCIWFSLSMTQSINAAESKNLETKDIIQTFEELANTKLEMEPVQAEIDQTDTNALQAFFQMRLKNYRTKETQLNQSISEFAAKGNVIIVPILDRIKNERDPTINSNLQNRAVEIFEKINTEESKKATADIILGRNGIKKSNSSKVLNVFLRMVQNSRDDIQLKLDARELLSFSNNKDFIGSVLSALHGVPIDPNLLEQLVKYVTSDDYYLRLRAASVLGASPSEEYKQERVRALINSFQTVEQLPNANERYSNNQIGTFADNMYANLAKVLTGIIDINNYLAQATANLTGNPLRWMLAVRAKRGDFSVKSDLRKILTDPNMIERTLLRTYALQGYAVIGTAEDIPFLKTIVNSDPVILFKHGGVLVETINGKPINNSGERVVLYDEITIREWETTPTQKIPFIQQEAQRAIIAIEDRTKK
jgi:hypothetical protein